MASFDTGWVNKTGWYLNVPYAMRVSGNVYRIDPWNIRVEGTAQLKQTTNTYGYEQINTEISQGLLGRAMHKPRTTSYPAGHNGATWDRNFARNFNVGTGAGTFSATFHGASTTTGGATVGSEQYLDFSCGYPTGATTPTGLSVSNVRTTENTVTANVKLTSWGEGATSSRYRELQVGTANNTNNQYFQAQGGGNLSGDITVSSASNKRGTISLTPNTRYYIGLYASNGSLNTGSQFPGVQAVTLATATLAVNKVKPTSIIFNVTATTGYRVPTTKIEYRRKGQTTWNEFATSITTGTGTIEVTGLLSYTEYEFRPKVTTTDGTWTGKTITTQRTKPNMKIIMPNGTKKFVAIKLIYPDGRKRVVTRWKKIVV